MLAPEVGGQSCGRADEQSPQRWKTLSDAERCDGVDRPAVHSALVATPEEFHVFGESDRLSEAGPADQLGQRLFGVMNEMWVKRIVEVELPVVAHP